LKVSTQKKSMLDEKAKRTLLRLIPHSLNICGVKAGEELNGFTLSWMTQASFKPPLVVIAVRQDSQSHAMIQASQQFAVSFLGSEQKDLAEKFFKPQSQVGGRLGDTEFTVGALTGCPIIASSLGYVECQVKGSLEHGDHTVFMAEVIAASIYREGEPLLLKDTGWQYGG
jgi:flavin reductase (DIM6/NTAB) family NADH-FMN oxidoreductase RutF